ELGRVDEEADHDQIALVACRANQRKMSFVQKAHRRYEADPLALAARAGERVAELGLGAQGVHALSPLTARARSARASYIGTSWGATASTAARWRSTVASSPRAT